MIHTIIHCSNAIDDTHYNTLLSAADETHYNTLLSAANETHYNTLLSAADDAHYNTLLSAADDAHYNQQENLWKVLLGGAGENPHWGVQEQTPLAENECYDFGRFF